MCLQVNRKSSELSESAPKLPWFREKFRWHLDHGTRPGRPADAIPAAWTAPRLTDALTPHLGTATPSVVAVRKWFRGGVVPRELYIDAILAVLFGDDPSLASEKRTFRELWAAARVESQGGKTSDDEDTKHDIVPSRSTDQWTVTDANNISLGLAALYLHPPEASNDPNTFLLQASLSLAQMDDEIEDLPVRLGLKAAQLVPTWTDCQPAETPELEHVEEKGGAFVVKGTNRSPEGHLTGKLLDRTTLASVEYRTNEPPSVRLDLRSRKLDLDVVPDDANRSLSNNRAKILQRFLQECQVSDQDRWVTWGTATLKRKLKA